MANNHPHGAPKVRTELALTATLVEEAEASMRQMERQDVAFYRTLSDFIDDALESYLVHLRRRYNHGRRFSARVIQFPKKKRPKS